MFCFEALVSDASTVSKNIVQFFLVPVDSKAVTPLAPIMVRT